MQPCPACGLPIRVHDHEQALTCLLILALLRGQQFVSDQRGTQAARD